MNSIFHRRSIRQFTPEVPDNGQIEQILKPPWLRRQPVTTGSISFMWSWILKSGRRLHRHRPMPAAPQLHLQ